MNILDILFPKHCINCYRTGSFLCEDCKYLIEILENQYCHVCGKRLPSLNYTAVCKKCKSATSLDGLYSACSYRDKITRKLITQLKFGLIKNLADPLSDLIISHFQLLNKEFPNTLLIPIPLNKKTLRKRGFNQSELIADNLSKKMNLPLITNVLFKEKETIPQAKLLVKERMENVKGVFSVKNREMIKDKEILLIDDLYTTGTTMEECTKILLKAGAKRVRGAVVAREEV